MTEKENRRSRMTRRLLRDALLELLKEKNISQITIKSICEQADMNRTTFYLHYQDQYALLDELVEEVYKDTEKYMNEVKESKELSDAVEAFMNYIKENKNTFRTLLVISPDRRLEEKLMRLSMRNMQDFMPGLPESPESEYIRIFVSEGSFSLLKNWIQRDFDLTVKQITALSCQLPDMVYRGIGGTLHA